MTEVMMALGEFRFSLDTAAYHSLNREVTWRWASMERIGAAPGGQYLGPGDDTIDLDGTIYPHHKGGLGQIDQMKAAAGLGTSLLLVDGLGVVWGSFALVSLTEKRSVFTGPGLPLRIDFTVKLQAVSEDS